MLAAATAACPIDSRVSGPLSAGGGTGGGGGAGGTGAASVLGTWRNLTSLLTTTGDTVISDTRWTFAAGGVCSRTVIQTFVNAGVEDTTTRDCTFTFDGSSVVLTFQGSSVSTRFSVTFSGPDLVLGGFRFTRIG